MDQQIINTLNPPTHQCQILSDCNIRLGTTIVCELLVLVGSLHASNVIRIKSLPKEKVVSMYRKILVALGDCKK